MPVQVPTAPSGGAEQAKVPTTSKQKSSRGKSKVNVRLRKSLAGHWALVDDSEVDSLTDQTRKSTLLGVDVVDLTNDDWGWWFDLASYHLISFVSTSWFYYAIWSVVFIRKFWVLGRSFTYPLAFVLLSLFFSGHLVFWSCLGFTPLACASLGSLPRSNIWITLSGFSKISVVAVGGMSFSGNSAVVLYRIQLRMRDLWKDWIYVCVYSMQ